MYSFPYIKEFEEDGSEMKLAMRRNESSKMLSCEKFRWTTWGVQKDKVPPKRTNCPVITSRNMSQPSNICSTFPHWLDSEWVMRPSQKGFPCKIMHGVMFPRIFFKLFQWRSWRSTFDHICFWGCQLFVFVRYQHLSTRQCWSLCWSSCV